MRIHTSTLTTADIYNAARHARVDVVDLTEHGSRSHDHAFNVKLEGESRRRPNGGASGKGYATGYAATWDQWGVFLAILFDVDPTLVTPYYADRQAFHRHTDGRFGAAPILDEGHSTNYHVVNGYSSAGDLMVKVHRLGADYWPDDAHGDHTFRFNGTVGHQQCAKCTAVQRWDR